MTGVHAAWDGEAFVVRGDLEPEQARVIARVLTSHGMDREAAEWAEAADSVEEAERERAEIDVARDRAFERRHPS